jgi:hypothetical protein
MRRADKVNVVYLLLLQRQHDVSQSNRIGFFPVNLMADIIVLAKRTHKVAAIKKNSSGPEPSNQGRLFSKMRGKACHKRVPPGLTNALFIFKAVDPAFSGAELAGLKHSQSSIYLLLKAFVFTGL